MLMALAVAPSAARARSRSWRRSRDASSSGTAWRSCCAVQRARLNGDGDVHDAAALMA